MLRRNLDAGALVTPWLVPAARMGPLVAQEPFRSGGRRLTERDFAAILETIREPNRAEFGSGAGGPE